MNLDKLNKAHEFKERLEDIKTLISALENGKDSTIYLRFSGGAFELPKWFNKNLLELAYKHKESLLGEIGRR